MSEDDDSFSEPKTDEPEALDSPPVLVTPAQDATISQGTRCYINGHARRKVVLMDPFTLQHISPSGSTDQYGDCVLTITRYLTPGLNHLTAELWDEGDWYMGTLVRRVSVLARAQGEGIEESPISAELLEANERPSNWGYSRPFFYNRQQGERVESRPSFGAGGHARSWLWIIDPITGNDLSSRIKTDGTGDTTFQLLNDLKPGINDLMLRLEGHGDWYMHSQALRVVVLPKPVTQNQTVNSQSATVTGSGGVEGAEISVDNETGTINYGKDTVRQGGIWSVLCRNLPVGDFLISSRQRIVQRFVENTYSERTVSSLRVQIVPIIDSPKEGETFKLYGKPLLIQGSGAAVGYKVRIKQKDGLDFGLADVDSDGKWTKAIDPKDFTGQFSLHVRHDELGGTGWSPIRTITLLSTTPPKLIIDQPVGTQPHDWPTEISGRNGIHNALVEVVKDLDHAFRIGTGIVQSTEQWKITAYSNVLPPGRHAITARQTDQDFPSDWSASRSFDIRPPALTKVDVTYPSANSIMFAGTGLNGASVEIRKVSGPAATMPTVVAVVNGQWETSANGWPFGTYQLVAIHKVPNGANGWIEALQFPFTVTYAVPIPYNVSSSNDYQPTLTGKGVLNGVVSFFDPDLSTRAAPDAPVNASDVWSSRVNTLWGPTWQRKVHIRQTINGQHSAFIVHNVDIPPLAPVIETVEKESLTPLISGKCWNNARVQLEFDTDGKKLDATVNGENWTFRRPEPFESGSTHTVNVTQIAAQQPSPPATETFKVERPMIVPGVNFPGEAEEVGRNLIVRGSGGMKDAIVILYDARFGNELGRSAAPLIADGEWVIELKTLSFRLYTVEVMQKIGERESARSEWSTFTVRLHTSFTDPLPGRTRTRDAQFEGLGLEGGWVDLYLGDASEPFARSIPVGAGGYWRAAAQLEVGFATVRAKHSFEAEVSEATVTFRVVPKAAFIETPADGEHIGGRTVVSGFGVAGDTVRVMLGDTDNTMLGETTVEGDGTWSVAVNVTHPGGDVNLVVVSSLGDFVSDASPTRPVKLGTYLPDITNPSEGDSVRNPVYFAGEGQLGEGVLCKWFNPEEMLAFNISVTDAGWSVEATSELSVGGSWAGFYQTLKNNPDGATLSDRVLSERFEVGLVDAVSKSHKTSDKR